MGDGGAGHQSVAPRRAAVVLKHGVHGNDHHVVQRDDDERRKAQRQHTPHDGRGISAPCDADGGLFAQQKAHRINAACELGEHRGDGRAAHAEAESEDEHRVQHDVEHRAQRHGFHAVGCEALAYDELVQAGGQQRKGRTQQVKGEIGLRIRVGGVACAEQPQHRLTKGQDGGGQRHREHAQHQKAVGQNAPRSIVVALAALDAEQRRAANAHKKRHRADHRHHRAAYAGACQRQRALAGDLADENAVHDAVKHRDELRQHAGQRDASYQHADPSAAKVVSRSHRCILPSLCGSAPYTALYHSRFFSPRKEVFQKSRKKRPPERPFRRPFCIGARKNTLSRPRPALPAPFWQPASHHRAARTAS